MAGDLIPPPTDRTALITKQFGFIGLPYPLALGGKAEVVRIPQGLTPVAEQQLRQAVTSANGAQLMMPTFLDGYQLPNEPLVQINLEKSLVITDLAGYDGSVIENMGRRPYQITISGVVVNETSEDYPEKEVQALINLCRKNAALPVFGLLFELFNITLMAVDGLSLPPEPGLLSGQPYQIRGFSDLDIDLLIRDNLETPIG